MPYYTTTKVLKELATPTEVKIQIANYKNTEESDARETGVFANGLLFFLQPPPKGLPYMRYTAIASDGRVYSMSIQWSNDLPQFKALIKEYLKAADRLHRKIAAHPLVHNANKLLGVKGWYVTSSSFVPELRKIIDDARKELRVLERKLYTRLSRVEATYWKFDQKSDISKMAYAATDVTIAYLKSQGRVSTQFETEVRTELLSSGMVKVFKSIRNSIRSHVSLETLPMVSVGNRGISGYGLKDEEFLEAVRTRIMGKELGLYKARVVLGILQRALTNSPFTWRVTKGIGDPQQLLGAYLTSLGNHCHGDRDLVLLSIAIRYAITQKGREEEYKWYRTHLLESVRHLIENPTKMVGFIKSSIRFAKM